VPVVTAGDRVIRGGLVVSLTVVTGVAVVISYGHLLDLARSKGETGASAATLPITVDGLVFAASLVILNAARHRSRPPVLAWVMLLAGIAATLAGNVAHGVTHGIAGAVIAGWPAAVAAGLFHLAIGEMRRNREVMQDVTPNIAHQVPDGAEVLSGQHLPDFEPETTVADLPPEPEPEPWTDAEWSGWSQWEQMPAIDPSDREPAEPEPTSDSQGGDETDPETEQAIATARDHFAETIATGRVPSIRAIRREINVGYPRAVKVRAALGG
jgi:hypothetical protein